MSIKHIISGNSLNDFILTLSQEEREMPIAMLPDKRIVEYIQAIFKYQLSVMPDLEQNATRSIMVLLGEISNIHISTLDINIKFEGTKDTIREEIFKVNITQIKEKNKSDDVFPPVASSLLKKEHEKFELFIQNENKVLILFKELCEKIPTKNNSNIALLTAGMLMIFEYLSFKNIAKIGFVIEAKPAIQKTNLKKKEHNDFDKPLSEKINIDISKFYRVTIEREEVEFILTYYPNNFEYKN